ncbi:hypothetical protein CYLTODRAFT_490559 [Cylindrobasidium torrendii FP15055 ss-10]|uniref:Uncharacterized protein n=1 Tax=Cylindrobasidium torrendii FP15055 ss-10 TaxID=1314674 RepID=A0A0D7BAB9_9AGAR|nr:hypothetical protein CYLTODRAFT_490559 [Cylindrobasidium torrendii FP15055 ss-10]
MSSLFCDTRSSVAVHESGIALDGLISWEQLNTPLPVYNHIKPSSMATATSNVEDDARSRRWSCASSAATESPPASPDISSPPLLTRPETLYSTSLRPTVTMTHEDHRRKRSSIIYKKSEQVVVPPTFGASMSLPELSTVASRKQSKTTSLKTVALTAWAWTIGAVLSRRKLAARQLHLKPLQLPAQHKQPGSSAAGLWKFLVVHLARKTQAQLASLTPVLAILPESEGNTSMGVECILP